MSKKSVTTSQRQHIAVLAADNQSLRAMSRKTGLHPSVCKRVAREPATQEMIIKVSKYLAEQMFERADEIIMAITPENIQAANLRDKCVAIGILTDKARQAYNLDAKQAAKSIQLNIDPIDLSKFLNE